jgi:glycosyltransferase involved in cell wall biosynthesis/uncharacterized membrane protein
MKIIIVPNAPVMAARHYCIAKALIDQGHEVHYMMWALPYNIKPAEMLKHLTTSMFSKTYKHEDITVHTARRLPYFWPYINGWLFKRQIRKLYKEIGADIIFTESFTNETEVPKDLPFIYDLADDYAAPADVYGSPIYKLAFKLLGVRNVMKRQCQNAIAVTAVSDILYKFAKQYNSNVHMVRNGLEKGIIEATLKDKSAKPKNKHSMVYVTRFGNWSRAIETLEATVKLKKEFPKLELHLVGEGTESEKMLAFISQYKAESYIHYHGFIYDRKEMYRLMSQSAIGLNISDKNKWRDAAHPIKVIEYSAFGMKVVSTNLAEVEALGFSNIFTFSDQPSDTLVDSLRKALKEKKTGKDFDEISKRVLEEYDWHDIVNQITNLRDLKPSVTHATPSYPPTLGGMEKVVQILARIQNQRGYKTKVLTSDQNRPEVETEGFPIQRLKTFVFANTRLMPSLPVKLARMSKRDIVHFHFASAYMPEVVWLMSKIRGLKYVAHMHLDFVPTSRLGFLLKLYKPYVLKYVLRSATAVVVFTKDQQKSLISQYGLQPTKVKVIPNGVEEKFYYDGKRSLHKKMRLLFVGRLEQQKNLSQLLYALDGVSDKFVTTIVGEGSLENSLKTLAKSLKLKNVKFVGRADGQVLLDHYKYADVFVLPSELEGMPLVLLEAMAMGLPIIATNVTGTRDVVGNNKNGLLIPFGDAKKLRAALLKLADNQKLYNKLSESSRAFAKQYSWSKVADKFENLYKDISKTQNVRIKPVSGAKAGVKLWKVVLPLLILANSAYLLHNSVGSTITLAFFLLVPGYLLLTWISPGIDSKWIKICTSLALSILIIMLGGLGLNTLHKFGLSQPLETTNIFILLDAMVLLLIGKNRQDSISIPKAGFSKNEAWVIVAVTILPLLAIGGAIRLNNGASNILTMMMFALSGLAIMFLTWRQSLSRIYPYALLMIGISVLFSTSLRGWLVTGHDIGHEFEVFQSTSRSGLWHTLTSHRDPYSACLSITILPTILSKITAIADPYIFKVVFQLIFAFMLIPIYELTNLLSSRRFALLGTLLFIAFPPFLNDMPFLNRQEIAFVFFGLLVLINFIEIARKPKMLLSTLLLIGLILSHYSSSYVTLGLLLSAWFFYKLITYKNNDQKKFVLPLLSLPLIVGAIGMTFAWNSLITQTSPGLERTIEKTVKTIEDHSFAQADGVNYGLFSFNAKDSKKVLADYAGDKAGLVVYVPDVNLPRTKLGSSISRIMPVETLNKFVRLLSAKFLQVLLITGTVLLFLKGRKKVSQRDDYYLSLVLASTLLLVLMVLVPQLSVEYSVTRLFQQDLAIIGLPIILATQLLTKKFGSYAIYVTAAFFVFLFLHLSGLVPQLLGGYPPQLSLNNAGTYYDIYYEHKGELISAQWIDEQPGGHTVTADNYGKARFPNYPFQKDIITNPIKSDDTHTNYLYQNYANVHKGVYADFLSGDVLEYRYQDGKSNRNLWYSNQVSEVLSKVE